MLWNDETAATVWSALGEAKEKAQSSYLREVAQLLDMKDNQWSAWMEGQGNICPEDSGSAHEPYLQRYFPNAWNNGNGYLQPMYMPGVQRIIETETTLFHQSPTFFLETPDGSRVPAGDKNMMRFLKMAKQCHLETKLKDAQRTTQAVKTTFLYPSWHFGKMKLEVLTPDLVWPWEHDIAPGDVDRCDWIAHELARPMMGADPDREARRFLRWTGPDRDAYGYPKGEIWTVDTVDVDGNIIMPGGGAFRTSVNLYNQYPYVVLHESEYDEGMFRPLDECYRTFGVGLCLLWTDYHLQIRTHGGVGVATLNGREWDSTKALGTDRTVVLADGESYAWTNPTHDLQGMLMFAQRYLQTFALLRGLSPDSFSIEGKNFATALSAAAMQTSRLDVEAVRKEQAPYYRDKVCDELLPKMVTIWNRWMTAEKIDPSLVFGLEYAEPKQVIGPQEQAQADSMDAKLGQFDPVLAIQKRRKLSETEAEAAFDLTIKRMERLTAATGEGMPRTSPDPETPPGLSAEE
jgi:hypothetical protein